MVGVEDKEGRNAQLLSAVPISNLVFALCNGLKMYLVRV